MKALKIPPGLGTMGNELVEFDDQFGSDVTWQVIPCPALAVRSLTVYMDEDGKAKGLPINHVMSALARQEVLGDALVAPPEGSEDHPAEWFISQIVEACGDMDETSGAISLMVARDEDYDFCIGLRMDRPENHRALESPEFHMWLGGVFAGAAEAMRQGVPMRVLNMVQSVVVVLPGDIQPNVRYEDGQVRVDPLGGGDAPE